MIIDDDLPVWQVTLTTGHVVHIRADSYGEVDGDYVFNALVAGPPPRLQPLARVPGKLVVHARNG